MNDLNIHAIAQDIADVMRWQYVEHNGWNGKIENPATQAVLWIADDRGRVRISGGFGDLYKYLRYERHGKNEITVSAKKTPPEMVNDIRRRLLPDYLKDLEYVKRRHVEHLERMKQVAQAALHFGAILNLTPPEVSEQEVCQFHLGFVEKMWGHVEVDTQGVDIKITDVPFEIAAMILVPIGEYIRAHPKEKDE